MASLSSSKHQSLKVKLDWYLEEDYIKEPHGLRTWRSSGKGARSDGGSLAGAEPGLETGGYNQAVVSQLQPLTHRSPFLAGL